MNTYKLSTCGIVLLYCLLFLPLSLFCQKNVLQSDKQSYQNRNDSSKIYITSQLERVNSNPENQRINNKIDSLKRLIASNEYELNNSEKIPKLYSMLANLFFEKNDFELALKTYKSASKAARRYLSGEDLLRAEAQIASSMATIFGEQMLAQQAIEYSERADSLSIGIKDTLLRINNLMLRSSVLFTYLKEHSKAIASLKQAIELAEAAHLDKNRYVALSNLCLMYLELDYEAQAIATAEQLKGFLDLSPEVMRVRPSNRYGILTTIGKVELLKKNYSGAESLFKQALVIAQKHEFLFFEVELYDLFNKLYFKMGKYNLGQSYHDKYVFSRNRLEDMSIAQHIANMEIKYKSLEKDKAIADSKLNLALQSTKLSNFKFYITLISLMLLGALSIAVFFWNRSRFKQRRILIMQQENEIASLKGVMEGEAAERKRIAGNIHDGLGGILAVMKNELQQIEESIATSGSLDKRTVTTRMHQLIIETADEVRSIANNLMPDALLRYDLDDALIAYRDNLCPTDTGLNIELIFVGKQLTTISDAFKLHVYRLIQELMQNIIKHAKADEATVQLIVDADLLKIIAEDNGKGFDVATTGFGVGLTNITYKIASLNGEIIIDSQSASGTTIVITLPLEKHYN